ncbi:LRR and NB-ARC domain disease resistance protein [Trifolium pratense]|uniref:LRR and NB-ARC domain disease resistance protein n=1 Tax=Trifolium pratense TaxID=57577 RepID=A0A2K3LJD0_TRIPR|nr:LRR and NB-ARC domain disease resistance protein [Trifolium pratense]
MLFSLPKMILTSTFLHELELQRIPSLTAFPEDGLPHSPKSLRIVDCENLTFLPPETWRNYTSLVYLDLENSCDVLTCFPLDGFPALQDLSIQDCKSLESIFISETSSSQSSMLRKLTLHSCNALISLPKQMDTLTTLEELLVSNCDTLRSLPGLDTLTSLKSLHLWGPQELMLSFSEGPCLPPNLQSIYIESPRITVPPMTEWGFQRLKDLSRLTIAGDMVNALLKEPLLPISLVNLSISKLSTTKSLKGNGLRHLLSLENLTFSKCSELESCSKDVFPSTLKSLRFNDCSALESLSEDTLPSSLKRLSIWRCPLLEAWYENKEHWSNIAHIPVIDLNGKLTM